jgi:hypothetical protein
MGKNLTDAVGKVMQANQGQVMTASLMAKALFEQVDRNILSAVKKNLNTVFARGVMRGRWQRVTGQKGAYVLR